MRILARQSGVYDGILRCPECQGPMFKVGSQYRCAQKVDPEEMVAVGFIPFKATNGNLSYESTAKDQQLLQATQAYSKSVEIDNTYLEKLGLNLEKIREYQLKHGLVP